MSRCAHGCGTLIKEGDGHDVCLKCLDFKHAMAAFVDTTLPHCGRMPIQTLRSWMVVFLMNPATTSSASHPEMAIHRGEGDMGISVSVNSSASGTRTAYSPSRTSDHPSRRSIGWGPSGIRPGRLPGSPSLGGRVQDEVHAEMPGPHCHTSRRCMKSL